MAAATSPTQFFDEGAAGFLTADGVGGAIMVVGLAFALTYAALFCLKGYQEWASNRITTQEVVWIFFKSLMTLALMMAIFTI